jgi:CheY-like chemotaxis protein
VKTQRNAVLLIDNNPDVLQKWSSELARHGYSCRLAQTSQVASQLFDPSLSVVVVGHVGPDDDMSNLVERVRSHRIHLIAFAEKDNLSGGRLKSSVNISTDIVLSKSEVPGLVVLASVQRERHEFEVAHTNRIMAQVRGWPAVSLTA